MQHDTSSYVESKLFVLECGIETLNSDIQYIVYASSLSFSNKVSIFPSKI